MSKSSIIERSAATLRIPYTPKTTGVPTVVTIILRDEAEAEAIMKLQPTYNAAIHRLQVKQRLDGNMNSTSFEAELKRYRDSLKGPLPDGGLVFDFSQ